MRKGQNIKKDRSTKVIANDDDKDVKRFIEETELRNDVLRKIVKLRKIKPNSGEEEHKKE
jgi:hypothetical protein